MELQKAKEKIVSICQAAFRQGLFAGTSGNLSMFFPATGSMVITPSGVRYETMAPEDVVVMTLDGKVLQGPDNPSSEWRMHAEIYKHLPQTGAVFHTHSPYATAFAVNHAEIPPTLIEMHVFLGGSVECADYATPGTAAVGLNAVSKLQGGKGGCLLANHGVLAVGKDLDEARLRAEYIEDAAKIYHFAAQIGTPVTIDRL